jgi:hypothetical protein
MYSCDNIWLNYSQNEKCLKNRKENRNVHFVFSSCFTENCAIYEIMWKKTWQSGQTTDDNKILRMRNACWVTKAAFTRTQNI